jgi:hypothetical protein
MRSKGRVGSDDGDDDFDEFLVAATGSEVFIFSSERKMMENLFLIPSLTT